MPLINFTFLFFFISIALYVYLVSMGGISTRFSFSLCLNWCQFAS